jgi:hypothetical protein
MKFLAARRLLAMWIIFAGCVAPAGDVGWAQENSSLGNVFTAAPVLPPDVKRVLVLPLASEASSGTLSDGCEMLAPVLRAELVKTGRFEIVAAHPETLRRCTGRLSWTGEEALPTNFFDALQQVYGCDAVMFCQLTVFRPNAPLAIGWRLKLTEVRTKKILWAVDEVFDARNRAVAKSALQFKKHQQRPHRLPHNLLDLLDVLSVCAGTETLPASEGQWVILHSPLYFGQYSAAKVLATLPQR